jgi:hypothetical protein
MINTLVIITDLRSTVRGAVFHELNTNAETAKEMFSDRIAGTRYRVEIFKGMTVRSYVNSTAAERALAKGI